MPAVYDKLGIRFLYPDNWALDEDDAMHGERTVTVYSPGGGFWSIAMHPPQLEPRDLAVAALKALQAEYPESEAEPVSEKFGDQETNGFDLNFYYLDLTSTALIRAFRADDASCLVLCQAEDREFETLGVVFRAITTSLLRPAG